MCSLKFWAVSPSACLWPQDQAWEELRGGSSCDLDLVLRSQVSLQPYWLSHRVMLVSLEPLVARVPLAFKECLVNEVQLVFQALRVTE